MTDLAHWERHGVLVTQDCPTCGGSVWLSTEPKGLEPIECPDCVGGKVPAEGVYQDIARFPKFDGEWRTAYIVPVPTDEEE